MTPAHALPTRAHRWRTCPTCERDLSLRAFRFGVTDCRLCELGRRPRFDKRRRIVA